jgi:hypothetical protein
MQKAAHRKSPASGRASGDEDGELRHGDLVRATEMRAP